jgi:hypothetical protein
VPIQLHNQAALIAVAQLLGDHVRLEFEHVQGAPAEGMAGRKIGVISGNPRINAFGSTSRAMWCRAGTAARTSCRW